MTTLRARLLFAVNITLLILNLAILGPILWIAALIRLIPITVCQTFGRRSAVMIAEFWVNNNNRILDLTLPTKFELELPEMSLSTSYLVLANHQSWVDIVVLQRLFNGNIPFLRFFLKQQLIWVPILGLCWWGLDFPFMKRLTKAQLQKNPELKGSDKLETIKQMQKFKDIPVSIMVFLEGTRFTAEKHDSQRSPYRHLLKPRAAGAAYTLSVLSEQLDTLMDVEIAYPNGIPTFADYISGRVSSIRVHARTLPITPELRTGDYENDKAFRVEFHHWINQLWQDKDAQMETLIQPASSGEQHEMD